MPLYTIYHDHELFRTSLQTTITNPSKDIAEGILILHKSRPRSLAPSGCVQFSSIETRQLQQSTVSGKTVNKPWIRITAEIETGFGSDFKQWLLGEIFVIVYKAIQSHDRRGTWIEKTEIQVRLVEVEDSNLLIDGVLGARSAGEAKQLVDEAVRANGGRMPRDIIKRTPALPPDYSDIN